VKGTACFPGPLLHMGLNPLPVSLVALGRLGDGGDGQALRLTERGHIGKPDIGSSIDLLTEGMGSWGFPEPAPMVVPISDWFLQVL